ncbi:MULTISPECIES: holdfast anchor protein HfaD [unclassified Phenylobacterium]|uniref:holdfast anchor protein HfaD n=1 Tax=unclassified Phenylobacterium TaxID=2640670 RepID=UPI00138F68E5|nr:MULTISPECIES: holdfast anchor protein HfaD [unclassified Phenylobacterium]
MVRRAKILLVGTFAAILPCQAATSQTPPSAVLNNQIQLGDVFSQQTLNVVEVSDFTTGASTASGNAYSAAASRYDADMRSYQETQGQVTADTRLDVASSSGQTTSLSTKATGNSGLASAYGATITGVYTQATGAAAVTAHSHTEAPGGRTGEIASQTQAAGNAQAIGLEYGSAGVRTSQTNAATVTTDGGGVYGYVEGTASYSATTAANDVTLSGVNGSAARIIVDQNNVAPLTQAAQFTAFANVQDAVTSSTAAGNNVNAVNEGHLLDVTSRQSNQAYVRAQTASSAYQYGAASASAYGVGNAIVAGDIGGELLLDTVQSNDGGGIEAVARFDGTEGYDAQVSSTAYGNSVTGYACSDCQGRLDVNNDQTNSADVGAQSVVNVTSGRSARGVANAVGNSATYYVSRPSGQ